MRTHDNGELRQANVEQTVTLCGWVQRRRDHGGVIFIDLRDRTGLVQVVFEPENRAVFSEAEAIRSEFVLEIAGTVRLRPEGMRNANLDTGDIEVVAGKLTVHNSAETPPFQLDEHDKTHEDVRLRYRYIDLRRPEMQSHFEFRSKLYQHIRNFMVDESFWEIETPILTKATPEGARDYLVPSRTHHGEFFALPQSPQLFKQLLMMSGMERYFQIARCFRDEDLRADRQPEFTQLDIEASFIDEKWIQTCMEAMMRLLFKSMLDVELPNEFPRMTYAEAMQRFGSDKPDLRIPLELIDIADLVKDVEFKVFAGPANNSNGRVAALRLPEGAKLTRKMIDGYEALVKIYGAKGLAYIKINDRNAGVEGLQSPILKFFPADVIEQILQRVGAETGDVVFFGADNAKTVNEALGALRVKLGHDLNLIEGDWAPLWIVDWPMFEANDAGGWDPLHHPFTSPQESDAEHLKSDPGTALARAYDMVINGVEIGGGSIRIHNADMQQTVFELLGINAEEAAQKFGFLLQALRYGCPPHGGIAFGLDRLVMIMQGTDAIRDVIAFPKTQTARCLLTGAPSNVSIQQLMEVGIKHGRT